MHQLFIILVIYQSLNLIGCENSEVVTKPPKSAVDRVTCNFFKDLCEYHIYNGNQRNGFVTPYNRKTGKLVSPEVTGVGPFCLFASYVSSGSANRDVLFKVFLDLPGADIELYSMSKNVQGRFKV